VIAGRYKKSGNVDVVISGKNGEEGREYHYRLSPGGEGQGLRDDFPARVWALRRIAELIDAIRLTGRQEKELVDEIVRLSTKFGILTEYTAFLADETADHGRVNDNRIRAGRELSEARKSAEAGDADGFAGGANQSARRGADKAPPPPMAPAPSGAPTTPGDPSMDSGTPATGGAAQPELLRAKDGKRDVEAQSVGGLRQIANRAFYYRSNVQNRRAVWVDAEVTDSTKADEVVERWSARFFELLASTSGEENTRLAQDGDVLLKLAGRQVLVTDAGPAK
jgi:Ca-activated chloride channel family protein